MDALARTPDGPEIEVMAQSTRRRLTPEYKRRVVREADACNSCNSPGAVGALLRREGVYSSHLS